MFQEKNLMFQEKILMFQEKNSLFHKLYNQFRYKPNHLNFDLIFLLFKRWDKRDGFPLSFNNKHSVGSLILRKH